MFGILFFVSGIGKIVDLISMIVFRNHEDCPFCNCKNSMRIIKTSSGYKKVCNKCKFSIEVDDNDENLTPKQKTMITNWFTTVPQYSATEEFLAVKKK